MKTSYSPGILSLLPLFYVGWSDSMLGPSERDLIIEKINKMPHLNDDDRKTLISWTDQKNPPEESIFKSWIQAIKENQQGFTEEMKSSLIQLGISMAKQSSGQKDDKFLSSSEVLTSLQELEKTLGFQESLESSLLFETLQWHDSSEENQNSTSHLGNILDGEFSELMRKIRHLLNDPFFQNKDIRLKEEYRERVLKQVKELAKQGYGAYAYPEEYGGKNNPLLNTVIFETVAQGDLSLLVKFGVQFGLFGGALYMLGTKKHHDQFLQKTANLELPGCFAMTETGHGSNVRGLQTSATYDEKSGNFIIHSPNLHAGKEYIGNALHSKMAVVFAQLIVKDKSHGVHAFLVPLRDENHELLAGVKVEDNGYKVGLNGVDNGRIWFDQVQIPRDNLLNKYGDVSEDGVYSSPIESSSRRFFTMLGALVAGRVCIALASNTASKKALTIAIRYALKRRQFSQSQDSEETLIMDYPSHQHRLFPRLAKTYALHFGLNSLRKLYAEKLSSGDMRKVESLAAGLKSVSSWHATDTIQECREACGGKGYLSENAFADLKADTDIFTTFEGDNNVLLQLVSKGLLTEFKEQFQDGGFVSILRHLGDRLSTSITEANPVTRRNTSAEHLLSEEFHIQALEYRENSLLYSLANRMRTFIKRRLNPNETYKLVQTHMINLAIASIDAYCAKEFYSAIEKVEDADQKIKLQRLARLYSLDMIYKNRGWYLEQDYLSGSKSKAIRKQVDYLCKKVRGDARMYVDSFNIPERLLAAEII